jgi:hypothetical protein
MGVSADDSRPSQGHRGSHPHVLDSGSKGMTMRNPMERLILSVAEFLDRNLIMVPDVDMTMAATAGSATALSTERQIPRTTQR